MSGRMDGTDTGWVGTPGSSRGTRGLLAVVAAVVLLVVGISVGTVVLLRPADQHAVDSAGEVTCPIDDQHPGPLVDLGVQAGTGRPARPVRSQSQVDALVAAAVDAGAGVVSTDVSWQNVLPREGAEPDFVALDRVLTSAESHGLQVRVQLVGSPSWAVGRAGAGTAADKASDTAEWRPPLADAELSRWADFVRVVMRHLDGRADYVEIWTEPDQQRYWTTGPDPRAFARLLQTSAAVIRAEDPDAVIVSGGLSGNDLGFLSQVYDQLGDGPRPFDMVGVHPFSGGRAPLSEDPSGSFEGSFGSLDQTFLGYRRLHDLMDAHGDGDLGIYVGEFGYSTTALGQVPGTPDRLRARYLRQTFAAATCTPYLAVLGWYYLHPTPWDDASWTLLDARGRPNRTYRALQRWATSPERTRVLESGVRP